MLSQYRTQSGGSLSAEQIEFYDREGYLVLPHLLNEADMAPAITAMESKVEQIATELYEQGLVKDTLSDRPFQYRLAELFQGKTDEEFLHYGRSWRDRLPGYFQLMANPKILDAVESLIGSEIFANPVYNTRPKVPVVAAGAVPWHQDKSYWPGANANPVITVWIPLVDATAENGYLCIWPGTHRQQVLSHHKENRTGTGYTELDQVHLKDKILEVAIPLEAGGAILFNDRCIQMCRSQGTQKVH